MYPKRDYDEVMRDKVIFEKNIKPIGVKLSRENKVQI